MVAAGRRGVVRASITVWLLLVAWLPSAAQQSASYKLSDSVFNAGGHPAGGAVMTSASFKISLDSIGDGIVGTGMTASSFAMDASFGVCYPPAGEVRGLRFSDASTLVWAPEKSTGDYNLYRDSLAGLSAGGYGNCLQQDLPDETAIDGAPVPAGDGFFYLVTAENLLGEEGTKGTDSGGMRRTGGVCP